MSGTSIDGIDAALVQTDGEKIFNFGPACTVPYSFALEQSIRSALGKQSENGELVRNLTDAHASAVENILSKHPTYKEKIQLIGLHGHTLFHSPDEGVTIQAGDGERLAKKTGYDVVYDFRFADVASGGQGAPLVPLFHEALGRDLDGPIEVVNIGGISNITWIDPAGDMPPIAFDTGPGNALLDDWVRSTSNLMYDRDGVLSSCGTPHRDTLLKLMNNPYFDRPPPKSLDRLSLNTELVNGLSPADGAATLVHFTCETIAGNFAHVPSKPKRLLITGGGRHNPNIMRTLAEIAGLPVSPVEAVNWDGDAIEAQAFAFLAVRSLRGLPLSLPSTTGVPEPTTGGRLARTS
tara:strand:- start:14024 stop:15073 length:1050 start_codon:yes stop_codon:yes gene_type:complete